MISKPPTTSLILKKLLIIVLLLLLLLQFISLQKSSSSSSSSSSSMESRVIFDVVKMDKERAMARFNKFRQIATLRQIMELAVVMALITWSSARIQPLFKSYLHYAFSFSAYLLNHHVVFLLGNAIIVLLFVLCRLSSGGDGGCGDFYAEYVEHRGAGAAVAVAVHYVPEREEAPGEGPAEEEGGEKKQLQDEESFAVPQCDEVSAAIRKARRQIKKFERTQSERLKREIAAGRRWRRMERFDAAEMERLSSEEFRRRVDAFIDEHWSNSNKNTAKQCHFEEHRTRR